MTELPDGPGGITPELLTSLLGQGKQMNPGCRIDAVQLHQVGDGTGMMAEIARVTVSYTADAGDLPASFIAKFSSSNPTNREIANSYHLPERETRFMSELDPQTETRTPRTYFSGLDGDRFLILMEDMTDYEVGSQVEGATLEQTELAIDELAKLHAPFWNRVGELDWVPHIARSYHAENMYNLSGVGFEPMLERFGEQVCDAYRSNGEKFLSAIPSLQAYMDSEPLTLCHGDYRMENLLYGTAADHDPIAVLDWQGPLRARGMNDVALFLGQSTKTEVRREHERLILNRYVEGLSERGVDVPDSNAVWLDYRKSILYNWVYVTVVAGTLDASNQTAFAWMKEMVARQSAASIDLDVFELLESISD